MVDIYSKLQEFRSEGKDVVVVTVTEKEGMGPSDVGKKMIVTEGNVAFGTIGGGAIEFYAREKCKQILLDRASFTEKYVLFDKDVKVDDGDVLLPMACGGKATLFYEFIGPKQYVYIFGGGHCGAALAKLLKPLGFYVVVIDDRKDVLDALDNSVDEKICSDFVKYIEEHKNLDNRYVVVATPSHKSDYAVLDKIFELNIKPQYFGMLCSKKKVADYLTRLKEKHIESLDLNNFYAPIGLQTGGDSPEEVAISIASEILTIYYKKDKINCHMRDK